MFDEESFSSMLWDLRRVIWVMNYKLGAVVFKM